MDGRALGRIANKKKHLNLLKKSKDLENELVQLDRWWDGTPIVWAKSMQSLCLVNIAFDELIIIL